MTSIAKRCILSAIRRLGYELIPLTAPAPASAAAPAMGRPAPSLAGELAFCRAMRDIHRQDAVELEELYRRFVFPDLPRRDGRAALLNDLIGTTVSEAIYIVQSLHQSLRNAGDVCEFGVAQGTTSRLLAAEIAPFTDVRA